MTENQEILDRYPVPVIRGARITRLGERYLGPVAMDGKTALQLANDQMGWFVGGVPTFERMVDEVQRINTANLGGRWIIIPATRAWAKVAYEQWANRCNEFRVRQRGSVNCSLAITWHDDNVTFCVLENLPELAGLALEQSLPIAGIILLDPQCIVHRGRRFGMRRGFPGHDRPQLLVDFRSRLGLGAWQPPLLVMSTKKAAAVPITDLARIYGLSAMQFIEGATIRCGVNKVPPESRPVIPLRKLALA